MKRGLIVGKFYPPHAGHHFLINEGRKYCDQLTVFICDKPEYRIPAKLRANWLRKEHPDITVKVIVDLLDDNDSPAWGKLAVDELGYKPDVVFTSESYGDPWSKAIGCEHKLIDMDRAAIPCSGTMARKNPFAVWQYLQPEVRAYFALRVCVVGAESTGKTTLARALAEHYKTEWVPEYGRVYSEEVVDDMWNYQWKTEDFTKIAHRQARMEDEAAMKANKLLVCDTDVFATAVWHRRYMGVRSVPVEALATKRPRVTLYIVPEVETPFEQDGFRDGEHIRSWMHQTFLRELEMWGKDYLLVRGTHQERMTQATKVIDRLLSEGTGISGKEILS